MTPRYPWLRAAALLIVCMSLPLAITVEARGRKGKSSISRRLLSRAGHPLRGARASEEFVAPAHTIVPDQIEVVENGSSRISELARYLSPAPPRNPPSNNPADPDLATPRTRGVNIESGSVIQIQQALARQGVYSGEMSGAYDETTASAMRRFQAANKITITGYPTAAALKRLGLTSW